MQSKAVKDSGRDPSTAQRRPIVAPSIAALDFMIEVSAGPDAGAQLHVEGSISSRLYLGKSGACHLRLSDPLVSRRHAALAMEGPRLRITDLESTNGTFVNGVPVVEAFLAGGEVLRVGDTLLRVSAPKPMGSLRISPASRFGRLIGASSEMRRLYPVCERLALSDVPLIIEGETGTGKELLAESIHEAGPRASQPFVVFDCTTVAPSLVESALFGHERGAFTGADQPRAGVFERAHRGTLLIDEIGDLDVQLQSKLLRALQAREVQRLGSAKWTKVDVRVIAATRRDLEKQIQSGCFRDDLYYRLAVARVELPPLRRRSGDVAVLAEYFWQEVGGHKQPLPSDFLERLEGYSWPGNVRELYNAVAYRTALGDLGETGSSFRPSSTAPTPAGGGALASPIASVAEDVLARELPFPQARQRVLDAFERRFTELALEKYKGNVTKAAAACGVARRYFYVIRSRVDR